MTDWESRTSAPINVHITQSSGITAFQVVTLVIAGLAFVVGVSTLTWQVASWRLAGSRVRVDLLAGALLPGGRMAAGPIAGFRPSFFATQGAREFYFVVRAVNIGRIAVDVTHWSVKTDTDWGYSLSPGGFNPDLPHRLEPGSSVDFYAPLNEVIAAMGAVQSAGGPPAALNGEVTLGTGKTVTGPARRPGRWSDEA